MTKNIIIILLLFSKNFIFSQITFSHCFNDSISNNNKLNDSNYINIINYYDSLVVSNYRASSLIGVKKIPVVFHFIGDVVLTSTFYFNALDQIEVLNNCYRKKIATNGYGSGVDVELEFCLAKIDPEGNITNGVVEVSGTYGPYAGADNTMKSISNWPSNKYLNIWVINTDNTYNGVSSFPWDFVLHPELDGIKLDYKALGYKPSNISRDLGHTVVHEVGHWLGLKHPWGDNSLSPCNDGDGCSDTPDAKGAAGGAKVITGCSPPNSVSAYYCSNVRQVKNYMEYSDDQCRNQFTDCQKGKMRGYLEAVRSQLYSPENKGGCDFIIDGGLNPNPVTTTEFCKDCCPRTEYLNISGGLKGSTSGTARELIASNIKAGGSGYYMTPATTGKVKLIADTRVTSLGAAYYGSITLTDGFYYYADNDTEIEFFLCDLKSEMPHADVSSECKRCGKFTDEPNPKDKDRNKRMANHDTIHGVYIKPPTQNNQQQSVLLKDLNINVFPNPSNNGIFNVSDVLNSNTFLNYKVINAIGTVVIQGDFTNTLQINLNNLAHGIYQIIVYNAYNNILKTISYN